MGLPEDHIARLPPFAFSCLQFLVSPVTPGYRCGWLQTIQKNSCITILNFNNTSVKRIMPSISYNK